MSESRCEHPCFEMRCVVCGTVRCDPMLSFKQEWISVEDGLPEQFDYIIGTDGFSVMAVYFQDDTFLSEGKLGIISHWMQFPNPPITNQDV